MHHPWKNRGVQHRGRAALQRRVKPPKETGLQPQWTLCLSRRDREGHVFNRAASSTVEERRFSAASSPKKRNRASAPVDVMIGTPPKGRPRFQSCRKQHRGRAALQRRVKLPKRNRASAPVDVMLGMPPKGRPRLQSRRKQHRGRAALQRRVKLPKKTGLQPLKTF